MVDEQGREGLWRRVGKGNKDRTVSFSASTHSRRKRNTGETRLRPRADANCRCVDALKRDAVGWKEDDRSEKVTGDDRCKDGSSHD